MKILSLSDVIVPFIYSPQVKERFGDVDLVIGCGDLPYYYQEYIISSLDVPLVYVRGNHSKEVEYLSGGERSEVLGGVDLHRRVIEQQGLLLAGVEGSLRYRRGPFMYSQSEMWWHVFSLIPGLLRNYLQRGRYLDIFVTHAPAQAIHDKPDLPHQGIKAFRWFIGVFQPALYFHGHVHVYHPQTVTDTHFGQTHVINTYGYRETIIEPGKTLYSKPELGTSKSLFRKE